MRALLALALLLAAAVAALALRATGADLAPHLGARAAAAALLVAGAALAAGLLAATPRTAASAAAAVAGALAGRVARRRAEAVAALLEAARLARAEEPPSFDPARLAGRDPFLRAGLDLVRDGVEPERIGPLLRARGEARAAELAAAAGSLRRLAGFAVAAGAAGALLLAALGQPVQALALPALAGALLGGLLLWPLAARIEGLALEERLLRETVVAGLVAIRLGQNPGYLREALAGRGGADPPA